MSNPIARIWLTSQYEELGRHEHAKQAAAELLEVNANLTAEMATEMASQTFLPPRNPDQMLANLRKAGLP